MIQSFLTFTRSLLNLLKWWILVIVSRVIIVCCCEGQIFQLDYESPVKLQFMPCSVLSNSITHPSLVAKQQSLYIFSVDPKGRSQLKAQLHLLVSQSVSGLPLTQLVNNSGSGRDIFLKSFGDTPGMFLHQFQRIPNFLYVCQSAHCLTSFLKLGYLWISPVLDDLSFSNFLETFLGHLCTSSE